MPDWIAPGLLALALVYIGYLRVTLLRQEHEFAELKKSVLVVPLPRKNTTWLRLLTLSVVLLSVAVVFLAVR
jgi:hypothetical protein